MRYVFVQRRDELLRYRKMFISSRTSAICAILSRRAHEVHTTGWSYRHDEMKRHKGAHSNNIFFQRRFECLSISFCGEVL